MNARGTDATNSQIWTAYEQKQRKSYKNRAYKRMKSGVENVILFQNWLPQLSANASVFFCFFFTKNEFVNTIFITNNTKMVLKPVYFLTSSRFNFDGISKHQEPSDDGVLMYFRIHIYLSYFPVIIVVLRFSWWKKIHFLGWHTPQIGSGLGLEFLHPGTQAGWRPLLILRQKKTQTSMQK